MDQGQIRLFEPEKIDSSKAKNAALAGVVFAGGPGENSPEPEEVALMAFDELIELLIWQQFPLISLQ